MKAKNKPCWKSFLECQLRSLVKIIVVFFFVIVFLVFVFVQTSGVWTKWKAWNRNRGSDVLCSAITCSVWLVKISSSYACPTPGTLLPGPLSCHKSLLRAAMMEIWWVIVWIMALGRHTGTCCRKLQTTKRKKKMERKSKEKGRKKESKKGRKEERKKRRGVN